MLSFFFYNDTATTEIYTLPLHDALPILAPTAPANRDSRASRIPSSAPPATRTVGAGNPHHIGVTGSGRRRYASPASTPSHTRDRKSTRLNSSHANISYAVFCLKKKKQ